MSTDGYLDVPGPSGGSLEVLLGGAAAGPTLLYHPGHPNGAAPLDPLDAAAGAAGLRLVAYSRPGYGTSTPRQPGWAARIADDVADAVLVLDAVGAGEFVTLGWSGGGPRALACAALLPDRCRAAASVAGVAPYDAEGLDWFAGMSEDNVAEYSTAADQGAEAYERYLAAELAPVFTASQEELIAALGSLLTPVDAAAVDGPLGPHLVAALHRAGVQGLVGGRDDGLMLTRPWGFDPASIAVPVAIWQGRQDAMVPSAHGAWLAERIPGAQAHLLEDEGHLTLMERAAEIVTELADLAGWT